MAKVAIFFLLLLAFVNPSFAEVKHPDWIYSYRKVAYGHWEWFKEVPVEDWIETLRERGAEVLVLGQVPGGNYSWLPEAVEVAHRKGMKVVLYVNFKRRPLIKKKSWRAVDWQGKATDFGDWCNRDYFNYALNYLVDLAEKYKFDGYLIDEFFSGVPSGSRSKACIELYRKKYHLSPPFLLDARNLTRKFYLWVELHRSLRTEFLSLLTEKLHLINPEFAVFVNQVAGWRFNVRENFLPPDVGKYVDGIMEEFGWSYKLEGTKPFNYQLKLIFQNKYLYSRRYGGVSFMWYLSYPQPSEEVRYKVVNSVAHGNTPVFPVASNLELFPIIWKYVDEEKRRLLQFKTQNPVAVVVSDKTFWIFEKSMSSERYYTNILGITQLLLDKNIPFDVLPLSNLSSLDDFKKYKVIIYPDIRLLPEAHLGYLADYLREGGLAIFLNRVGEYKLLYEKRDSIFNIKIAKSFIFSEARWYFYKNDYQNFPFLKKGDFHYYKAWQQGRLRKLSYLPVFPKAFDGELSAFLIEGKEQISVGEAEFLTDGRALKTPVFTIKSVGHGRLIWFPYDLGNLYYQNSFPPVAELLSSLLKKEIPKEKFDYFDNAVEVNLYSKGILLINQNLLYNFGSKPNNCHFDYIRKYPPAIVGRQGKIVVVKDYKLLGVDNED